MSQRLCLSTKCRRARHQSEAAGVIVLISFWLTALPRLLQPAPSKAGLGQDWGRGWPQGPLPEDKLNGTWETPNNCVSSSAGNSIVQEPLALQFIALLEYLFTSSLCQFQFGSRGKAQKQPKWCYKIWYELSNTPDREGVKKVMLLSLDMVIPPHI